MAARMRVLASLRSLYPRRIGKMLWSSRVGRSAITRCGVDGDIINDSPPRHHHQLVIAAFVLAIVGVCLGLAALTLSIVNAVRISKQQRRRRAVAVAPDSSSNKCPSCNKLQWIGRIVLEDDDDNEREKKKVS